MEQCPCCSSKIYSDCCEPFIKGESLPSTAEELMRSRYTAHVKAEIPYILDTVHPSKRSQFEYSSILSWCENTVWDSLEILNTKKGEKKDKEGKIEFLAYFREKGVRMEHHEISSFLKEKERWYFYTGKDASSKAAQSTKVGRNEPCPCGSGKKYKKCCQNKEAVSS